MGQRHQAFIIARVVPYGSPPGDARYRCVGALHHQWCYGRLPLKAATRFITLIKQEDNATVIREELRAIDGLYGRHHEDPPIPDIPCPFTDFLFQSAWTTELDGEQSYKSSTFALEAGMGSTEGDNNDGITIIDITDPKNPSYCFFASVYVDGAPPLSATGYVRRYYREPTPEEPIEELEENVLSTIEPFESVPLITIQALAEAWPNEYTAPAPAEVARDDEQPLAQGLPTLTDLALGPALEQVLISGNIDEFELITAIPDKTSKIKAILRSRQQPIPDSGIPLLEKLFEHEIHGRHDKMLDLSQLPLSGQQILNIVTQQVDLDALNLSHNNRVSIDVVEKILAAVPKLRRLLVLNTGIVEEDTIALLERRPELFRNLEAFIHPVFFKTPSEPQFQGAYMHISNSNYGSGAYAICLPFFTTGQIVQGLTDYFNPLVEDTTEYGSINMNMDYTQPVMAAYASQVRRPGHPWGERIVPFIPATLPPRRALARKGRQWLFVVLPPSRMFLKPVYHVRYAFARASGEVWDKFLKMMDQVNQGAKDSTPPMSYKEREERISEIFKGLEPPLLEVFDIQQFFKELESEGRAPPSPEALDRLFNIFSKLGGSGGPQLIDTDELVPLLTTMPPHYY